MVAIIANSAINALIVKNKDARSESIDSFSSTIDVHAPSKSHVVATHHHDEDDDSLSSSERCQFDIVTENGSNKNDTVGDDLFSKVDTTALDQEQQLHLRQVLQSTILTLSSPTHSDVRNLLDAYNGHLVNVGHNLLTALRNAAPSQLAARVGDYNENLFYEMRDMDQNVGSIIARSSNNGVDSLDSSVRQDIHSFENSIQTSLGNSKKISYRGSFMQTESTMYQPAHVDYDYPILSNYSQRLFLAFFPLTEEGAFLQLWQDQGPSTAATNGASCGSDGNVAPAAVVQEGTVVYIPYGKMLILPSDTIHGGGFKCGKGGNLRFHLYIDVEEEEDETSKTVGGKGGGEKESIALLEHPMNKYTEKHDRRRELCERFVDAEGLESLLGVFFDV
mmetsp:Transcript_43526/g.74280  ORF Transcript_43526/g.74280 Transcript_43526/m.74280 type:complete len:391 (+) Transcript_43526:129-1301(+)